jgi:thiol:disulfide interchange protein
MKRTAMITATALITVCAHTARAEWVGGTGAAPSTVTSSATAPRTDRVSGTAGATNTVTEHSAVLNWENDYDTALKKAKKDKKLVMVDLYTDWCGWCKKLDRDTYSDKNVQAMLGKSFVAVKLNPEKSPRANQLARQFGTRGFPHILFLDDSGKMISEISGYRPAKDFQESLDAVLKKAGK